MRMSYMTVWLDCHYYFLLIKGIQPLYDRLRIPYNLQGTGCVRKTNRLIIARKSASGGSRESGPSFSSFGTG